MPALVMRPQGRDDGGELVGPILAGAGEQADLIAGNCGPAEQPMVTVIFHSQKPSLEALRHVG